MKGRIHLIPSNWTTAAVLSARITLWLIISMMKLS